MLCRDGNKSRLRVRRVVGGKWCCFDMGSCLSSTRQAGEITQENVHLSPRAIAVLCRPPVPSVTSDHLRVSCTKTDLKAADSRRCTSALSLQLPCSSLHHVMYQLGTDSNSGERAA
jgi:hypothetical protein